MHILEKFINFQELKSYYPETMAILWDMDGTIMETEQVHATAFINLLIDNGVNKDSQIIDIKNSCVGMTDMQVLDELHRRNILTHFNHIEFLEKKNIYLMQLVSKLNHEEILSSKIKDLLEEIKINKMPQAIVTSSERNITEYLLNFLNLNQYFDFVITREDVSHNKPHPMPYLSAIEKLGFDKKNITIFEDSPTGLQAALQSGANVFHVKWYSDPTLANN